MGLFDDLIWKSAIRSKGAGNAGPVRDGQTSPRQSWAAVLGLNPDDSFDPQRYLAATTSDPNLNGGSMPRSLVEAYFGNLDDANDPQMEATNSPDGSIATPPLVNVAPGDSSGHPFDPTNAVRQHLRDAARNSMPNHFAEGLLRAPTLGTNGIGIFDDLLQEAQARMQTNAPLSAQDSDDTATMAARKAASPAQDGPDGRSLEVPEPPPDSGFWPSFMAEMAKG